jgi:hypothetical protein
LEQFGLAHFEIMTCGIFFDVNSRYKVARYRKLRKCKTAVDLLVVEP